MGFWGRVVGFWGCVVVLGGACLRAGRWPRLADRTGGRRPGQLGRRGTLGLRVLWTAGRGLRSREKIKGGG